MKRLAEGKAKNPESENLRIQGFKKEFKLKLNKLVNNQIEDGKKYNSDIH